MMSFISCNSISSLKSTKKEQTAVMKVNGIEVPMEIYRYAVLNQKKDIQAEKSDDFWNNDVTDEVVNTLKQSVEESIKKMYVTAAMCVLYDIDIDGPYIELELDEEMAEIYATYDNNYKAYEKELNQYFMNDAVYRFIIRNDILADELIFAMGKNDIIPDTDEEFEKVIYSPDIIRVKQILITNENGKSDNENYELALEILNKAKKGADFDDLISEYGMDIGMFNNKDGYYLSPGNYHVEFEEAAYALDIGEISDVIKTDAGYSIIKRYSKEDTYIKKNYDNICEEYIIGQYNLILEDYISKLTVEYLDEINNYDPVSLKMK